MLPSVDIVYIYVVNNPEFIDQHNRFVSSYAEHPPGYKHRTIVVFNGGTPSKADLKLTSFLQRPHYIVGDNSGLDLGGFFDASLESDADFCLYCGTNVHFWKRDWLLRMVNVWKKYGSGCYGVSASYEISPHFNTTGFWVSPDLMNRYPFIVKSKVERYNFEHGNANLSLSINGPDTHQCMTFWKRCFLADMPVLLVTWDGEYNWWEWRKPANIYRRGDQSNMLLWWKHSDLWAKQNKEVKAIWSKSADVLTDKTYNLQKKTFK